MFLEKELMFTHTSLSKINSEILHVLCLAWDRKNEP